MTSGLPLVPALSNPVAISRSARSRPPAKRSCASGLTPYSNGVSSSASPARAGLTVISRAHAAEHVADRRGHARPSARGSLSTV